MSDRTRRWTLALFVTPDCPLPLHVTRPAVDTPAPRVTYTYFRPPWRPMPRPSAGGPRP